MASVPFDTLQTVHVVGAMVVVGYLAVIPMWRAALRKDAEPGVVRAFLETLRSVQHRVVLPALGIVVLTGILLSNGPLAERASYSLLTWRPGQAGLAISLILAVILWSGLGGPAKKMLDLVEKGEHAGPAMDKLWGDWRTALVSAALLSLVATAVMVFGAFG
ncbi:MAG TPA: hypothetical protein VM582_03505 [Candidatus Thermoplasmatota archaeon]|nr:hypothetical protein [Candidatus Thermoplasmatota archaeon]